MCRPAPSTFPKENNYFCVNSPNILRGIVCWTIFLIRHVNFLRFFFSSLFLLGVFFLCLLLDRDGERQETGGVRHATKVAGFKCL